MDTIAEVEPQGHHLAPPEQVLEGMAVVRSEAPLLASIFLIDVLTAAQNGIVGGYQDRCAALADLHVAVCFDSSHSASAIKFRINVTKVTGLLKAVA